MDVLVGVKVAVFVTLTVGNGVAEAVVGVSFTGKNWVRVGLPVGRGGVFTTGMFELPQLVTIMHMKTMLTNKRLILILVSDLHLYLPNGLKQRPALLETCFTQVA